MAIIFGGDTGLRENALDSFWNGIKQGVGKTIDALTNAFTMNLVAQPPPIKENVHVDSGFSNVPGTAFLGSSIDNIDDIQQRQVTTQEPILTVYVKKRAFRSLRNENNFKYLDDGEKLFLRATKLLFEKKCQQIAAYEALTKAKSLMSDNTEFDEATIYGILEPLKEQMVVSENIVNDMIFNNNLTYSTANASTWAAFNAALSKELSDIKGKKDVLQSFMDGLESVRQKTSKLRHATTTTWVVDQDQPDLFLTGRGSGVIELTLVSDLRTNLAIDGSIGSIEFNLQDPYNLTKITNNDIEAALAAANAELEDKGVHDFTGPQVPYEEAIRKEELLRRLRKDRFAKAFRHGGKNNAALSSTDAEEIIFEVNASSSAQNRVSAFLPSIPEPFNKNNFAIAMGQLPLEEQLTPDELLLVTEIFDLLEKYVYELKRINNNYILTNKSPDVTYARNNLRIHYLGKAIIQPMDSVNVYIRGNTFRQDEIIGPLGKVLDNSGFIRSFDDNLQISEQMLEEEMKILGIDNLGISAKIYAGIRTSGLLRNAGTHVFGGIIATVSESYSASSGIYTTSVSGASNMKWLDQSRVNVTPSLDQTQGMLEDPLTMFDIETNPGTGLPVETKNLPPFNKSTDERIKNSLVFYNNGAYSGKALSQSNIAQDYIDNQDGTAITQFKHAPGIKYKWKSGILALTRNINLKTTQNGEESQRTKMNREVGMTTVTDPFAGQDAADIVSLLVTGFPHNYEAFYENSLSSGTYTNGAAANSPESFFHSFFDIHQTQNKTFGNFQPFKTINVDPAIMQKRLASQKYLKTHSKNINKMTDDLARLKDRQNSLNSVFAGGESEELKKLSDSLGTLIADLEARIDKEASEFKNKASEAQESGLRLYGSDIAFDFDGNSAFDDDENEKKTYAGIVLRNSILQFRPQYECKFNTDSNLFIIGDEYDKDLDIQAFVLNMSQNLSLFDSTFKTPLDICGLVSRTIDFEFFCDASGHIQFRPPRYNKVPLSLLLKMLLLDRRDGKKLYPPFLDGLLNTRKDSIKEQIKVVDLNIEIEGILLNAPVSAANLTALVKGGAADPEVKSAIYSTVKTDTKDLARELVKQRSLLRNIISGQKSDPASEKDLAAAAEEILSLNDPASPNMYVKRQHHINKLAQLGSKRERLEQMAQKMEEQDKASKESPAHMFLNMTPDSLGQLGYLIEDDMNDFLGPNSSKRFIIYDRDIISSNFTESCENVFCRVDVSGEVDLIGDGLGSISGVPALWAGATDFDLWRQYGYKPSSGSSRPFLKDAETQCAPYAMMLLSRNRRNAIQGSVTVTGNEYYQLGDVVYVNSRDMLFYVTTVSHQFSYEAAQFTTTLTLQYGRTLGDYIPSPLDIIGKSAIKSQIATNKFAVSRVTTDDSSGRHVACIAFSDPSSVSIGDMLSGPNANYNIGELKNALLISGRHISSEYPKIEVRGFSTSAASDINVQKRINAVVEWLKAPVGVYNPEERRHMQLSNDFIDKKLQDSYISKFKEPVKLYEDLAEDYKYTRIPKEEVFGLMYGNDKAQLERIIEIVIVFEEIK